jgi:hypothetical protein
MHQRPIGPTVAAAVEAAAHGTRGTLVLRVAVAGGLSWAGASWVAVAGGLSWAGASWVPVAAVVSWGRRCGVCAGHRGGDGRRAHDRRHREDTVECEHEVDLLAPPDAGLLWEPSETPNACFTTGMASRNCPSGQFAGLGG